MAPEDSVKRREESKRDGPVGTSVARWEDDARVYCEGGFSKQAIPPAATRWPAVSRVGTCQISTSGSKSGAMETRDD